MLFKNPTGEKRRVTLAEENHLGKEVEVSGKGS